MIARLPKTQTQGWNPNQKIYGSPIRLIVYNALQTRGGHWIFFIEFSAEWNFTAESIAMHCDLQDLLFTFGADNVTLGGVIQ